MVAVTTSLSIVSISEKNLLNDIMESRLRMPMKVIVTPTVTPTIAAAAKLKRRSMRQQQQQPPPKKVVKMSTIADDKPKISTRPQSTVRPVRCNLQ